MNKQPITNKHKKPTFKQQRPDLKDIESIAKFKQNNQRRNLIIEKLYAKSIPNQIYTFPKVQNIFDDDTLSFDSDQEEELECSHEKQSTFYDLKSQNKKDKGYQCNAQQSKGYQCNQQSKSYQCNQQAKGYQCNQQSKMMSSSNLNYRSMSAMDLHYPHKNNESKSRQKIKNNNVLSGMLESDCNNKKKHLNNNNDSNYNSRNGKKQKNEDRTVMNSGKKLIAEQYSLASRVNHINTKKGSSQNIVISFRGQKRQERDLQNNSMQQNTEIARNRMKTQMY